MDINTAPTLKTHILTTNEASALIDWSHPSLLEPYPLPTEVVLHPGNNTQPRMHQGLIWYSLSEECECVGTKSSYSVNRYLIAQVYGNEGDDGHVLYTLSGWLHLTTFDLDRACSDTEPLYKYLATMYWDIEQKKGAYS